MTFLLSFVRGASPPCHCQSPASCGASRAACFSRLQGQESLLSSSTICSLEVNVETFLGIYLSVPVWLLLPEPYGGLGQGQCPERCWLQHGPVCRKRRGLGSGQRLGTSSPEIMSVCVSDEIVLIHRGKIQAGKAGLKQTALSGVPW